MLIISKSICLFFFNIAFDGKLLAFRKSKNGSPWPSIMKFEMSTIYDKKLI